MIDFRDVVHRSQELHLTDDGWRLARSSKKYGLWRTWPQWHQFAVLKVMLKSDGKGEYRQELVAGDKDAAIAKQLVAKHGWPDEFLDDQAID